MRIFRKRADCEVTQEPEEASTFEDKCREIADLADKVKVIRTQIKLLADNDNDTPFVCKYKYDSTYVISRLPIVEVTASVLEKALEVELKDAEKRLKDAKRSL